VQNGTDAGWTLKIGGKVRYRADGTPLPMIAFLVFGYKSHISIDRCFGFVREMTVTSASAADGHLLRPGRQYGQHRLQGLGRQCVSIKAQ